MTATDKLAGIKPGDRVRVTFEARVLEQDDFSSDTLGVALDGSHAGECVLFPRRQRNAPTFHIERLEKPLEVGDRVFIRPGLKGPHGTILAISCRVAWVLFEPHRYESVQVDLLERIA